MKYLVLLLTLIISVASAQPRHNVQQEKSALFSEIQHMAKQDRSLFGKDGIKQSVIDAMKKTPREKFVQKKDLSNAYENRPLPIGYGQTISQPFIVAAMTDLLNPQPRDTVLEIGAGSAYQAAILSHLVKHVYTLEIVPQLANRAASRLKSLGINNVTIETADGYYGWPQHAPYNKIIVTAAANHIPHHLINQLAPNGIMLIPIGNPYSVQHLTLIKKNAQNKITTQQIMLVRFVPFIRSEND